MNKIILSMVCVAAAFLTALAATDDKCLYYSTKGVDTYQDGKTVLDGEFYALVWVKDGSSFSGFQADGALVDATNNRLISLAPYAEDGHLDEIQTQVSQTGLAAMNGGSLYVILLDTRNADGTLSAKVKGNDGRWIPTAVNGYKGVYSATMAQVVATSQLGIALPIRVDTASLVPADAPKPVITAIDFREGANGREMVLKVKGTAAYLRYTAAAADLGGGTSQVDATAENGKADVEQEIEIVVPATEASGFFKVIRK